jgi:hypothetical protein
LLLAKNPPSEQDLAVDLTSPFREYPGKLLDECSKVVVPDSQILKRSRRGAVVKLAEDNEGLIAGAAALNGSASPMMATEICNAASETTYPDKDLKICRNTFMKTLKAYTDFESVAILR